MRRGLAPAVLVVLTAVASLTAQQSAPDLILSNGKIVTVDERFSVAQAVAVRGDRVLAVGTNQEIARLAGPATRRIDLRGRTGYLAIQADQIKDITVVMTMVGGRVVHDANAAAGTR